MEIRQEKIIKTRDILVINIIPNMTARELIQELSDVLLLTDDTGGAVITKINGNTIEFTHKSDESNNSEITNGSLTVLQVSKGGKMLKEYKSVAEAERQTGIHRANITACCKGKRNTAGRYIWKVKYKGRM